MSVDNLTKNDARNILEWIRTSTGQDFMDHVELRAQGARQVLEGAGDLVSIHRAQGHLQAVQGIHQYFEFAMKVRDGEIKESDDVEQEDQAVPYQPSPWTQVLDDSAMEGRDPVPMA